MDARTVSRENSRERESLPETKQRADLRDYLAAERTFLAWIRTGLALMGFGFVVARFGVFSKAFKLTPANSPPAVGISVWCGAALVVIGIALTIAAIRRHLHLIRQFNQGRVELSKS